MSCPFTKEALDKLKQFIDVCVGNPDLLSSPELSFFKEFIESFGGRVSPPAPKMSTEPTPTADPPPPPEEAAAAEGPADSEPESDLELDNAGCVEPDTLDDAQKMGDADREVSEEDADKSEERRTEAMTQFSEGHFERAVELLTEAIELNPGSALQFAKRGQAYLKLSKPNACIKDCSKALELNPDSATAYKFRGRAFRLVGEWERAAKDLRQACKIDFDEQTDEWLKEVTPNAKKIEQHKLKLERKKVEKEQREKVERARKAREAHAKAGGATHSAEGGFAPGAAGLGDFTKLMQDPEIMKLLSDPEVAAALRDVSSNPANFVKYKSNPKVMSAVAMLSSKFAASGVGPGMGGFPGGFPGFGGMTGGAGAAPPSSFMPQDDDNLD